MDFEDRVAQSGCTLRPADFRRVILDTFGEWCEPDELEEIVESEEIGTGAALFYTMAVQEMPGCEDVDPEFIIETLGRLLGDDKNRLTPTEIVEVGNYYHRLSVAATEEMKRRAEVYVAKFGSEFTDRLPPGVTVDEHGKVHVEPIPNPFDVEVN